MSVCVIFYLGYPITFGDARNSVTAETPDGRIIYEGCSLVSARTAIRYDRRQSRTAMQAFADAHTSQARRSGYRDAATRYDPTDTKGDTA